MQFKRRILKSLREELYMMIKRFLDKIHEYYWRLKNDQEDDKNLK